MLVVLDEGVSGGRAFGLVGPGWFSMLAGTIGGIGSTRIFQVKILAADFRAKEVGHCVGTVFANIKGAERAVKRRERNRACEPVVAGVLAP